MPESRLIDPETRIFELRPGPHRIAYVEQRGVLVLLHAWRKRSQGLDRRELARAQANLNEWREAGERSGE